MPNVVTADKVVTKTGTENVHEKVVEKRRALGRGLESLLPGPRVVMGGAVSAPAPPAAISSAEGSVLPPHSVVAGASQSTKGASSEPRSSQVDRGSEERVGVPSARSGQALRLRSTIGEADAAAPLRMTGASEAGVGSSAVINSAVEGGRAGVPVAPSVTVDLQAAAGGAAGGGEEVVRLAIDRIDENPYQTRTKFEEKALMELAQSIRTQGVLQPIVVRPGADGYFKLILGERRLRAARLAGMEEIPAIVKRVSEQQAAEMTIVENLQRQDLNCVDQATAFANLSTEFKLTQEQIGARVGMSRESVSNYMRLLTLSEGIIGALQKGTLTYSHARALLMVQDTARRWTIAKKVIEEKMSVARLEDLVQGMVLPRESSRSRESGGARWVDPNVKAAQRSLEEVLGMKVRIKDRHGRGKILIEYATIDDFDRVVRMLNGK